MRTKEPPKLVVIGIDPAFRKRGFAVSIHDLREKSLRFKIFKDGLLQFLRWIPEQKTAASLEGIKVIVGVENSNLADYTFSKYQRKGFNNALAKSRDVGKNMAASQNTVDLVKHEFGEEAVFEFVPSLKPVNGYFPTGGKKSHLYFMGLVRDLGIETIYDYKPPMNRNEITSDKTQDYRDAFNVGRLALQRYKRSVRSVGVI